jgi:branched-chain amino acid transport system substrate-binding protein
MNRELERQPAYYRPFRWLRVLALAAVLAVVAAACSSSPGQTSSASASHDSSPIKVGVLFTLSGPAAPAGTALKSGIQYWSSKNPTLLGRKVQFYYVDDQGTASGGSSGVRQLIDQDGVNFILGPFSSVVAGGALPITDASKIPVALIAALDAARDPANYPYVFPVNSSSSVIGTLFVQAAAQLGAPKIGYLGTADTVGEALNTGIRAAKASNQSVVGAQFFTTGVTDLTTQLGKLKSAGADILVCASTAPDDYVTLFKGLQALGWHVPVLAPNGAANSAVVAAAGPAYKSSFYMVEYPKTLIQPISPATQAWVTGYAHFTGQATLTQPVTIPAIGYDAMAAMAAAVKGAKSTNASAMKSYLERAGGFTGVDGHYTYTAASHAGPTAAVYGLASPASFNDGLYSGKP